jgi:biotin operon repressor
MNPIKKDPHDFAMLTRGYIRDMRELTRRSLPAFQVFMLLAERMNKTNAVVVSQATLGQILGYGRTTIHNAVRLLEAERWLQIVKIGTANGYVLNSKVLWRDHSGKRYASFYAEVLVSESEQGRPIEDWDDIELRHVPVLHPGETVIADGSPLPPPDQTDLLPPDTAEFPHQR